MKVLIACEKFKGSLSATQACEAIANGFWEAAPGTKVDQFPMEENGGNLGENLRERILAVDLVVTGEGSLDAKSLEGDGAVRVARLAGEAGKPVIAMVGRVEDGAEELFDRHYALAHLGVPLDRCMALGAVLLRNVAKEEAAKW